jgi:hypothetical protein
MGERISIISKSTEGNHRFSKVIIGERTESFIQSQNKLDDDGKMTVVSEAQDVLKHCIAPGVKDNITNIAVGYIQSGKTLSYTTLTTLAADNGFRIIIYLTGVTTSLNNQTYGRIQKDLKVNESEWYSLFEDNPKNIDADIDLVASYLKYSTSTLLFPAMKQQQHIERLIKVFSNFKIKEMLADIGVLIIDDEADQASFNTYAKRNADKPDWEEDEQSRIYSCILKLRTTFPCMSYIQYTATPQAAFLIDSNDDLSPQYHTVLTPGRGYTGGKTFFCDKEDDLIVEIKDLYDKDNNPKYPESLDNALQQFIISVTILVYVERNRNISFLSMMIHPDGSLYSNERFYNWVKARKDYWLNTINLKDGDPGKAKLIDEFRNAYNKITKLDVDPPVFEEVLKHISFVLLRTKLHLVQSKTESINVAPESDIKWDTSPSHILIGANILNRGFTVENLSMTYMPRFTKGKATADTIEQRCRFFGYKSNYIDYCRVYLPKKSIEEYEAYVEHEEKMHSVLKQCESLKEYAQQISLLHISDVLNPTRTNILSNKLVRNKMSGWRTMASVAYRDHNKIIIENLLSQVVDQFKVINPEMTNIMRKHRYVAVDLKAFVEFFKRIQYGDMPNLARKIATIQYLQYLNEKTNLDYIYLIEMAYELKGDSLRKRTLTDGKPVLMMGRDPKNSLPGDDVFNFEDSICFQLHHFTLKDSGWDSGKDYYSFAVYYPEVFGTSFISVEQDNDEDNDGSIV